MTCPQRYHPPGRLTPAVPGCMIWQAEGGPVYAVGKHFVRNYIDHPPADATLETMAVAIANLNTIEEVDEILKKLSNIAK